MPSLKHIWRLASIKQSAGRAGPHAEKGAEEKNKKNTNLAGEERMHVCKEGFQDAQLRNRGCPKRVTVCLGRKDHCNTVGK